MVSYLSYSVWPIGFLSHLTCVNNTCLIHSNFYPLVCNMRLAKILEVYFIENANDLFLYIVPLVVLMTVLVEGYAFVIPVSVLSKASYIGRCLPDCPTFENYRLKKGEKSC